MKTSRDLFLEWKDAIAEFNKLRWWQRWFKTKTYKTVKAKVAETNKAILGQTLSFEDSLESLNMAVESMIIRLFR